MRDRDAIPRLPKRSIIPIVSMVGFCSAEGYLAWRVAQWCNGAMPNPFAGDLSTMWGVAAFSQLLLAWYVPRFVRYVTVVVDSDGISQRRWIHRVRLRWRDVEALHAGPLFIRFVGKGVAIDVNLEFFVKPEVTVQTLERLLNAHKVSPPGAADSGAAVDPRRAPP